MLKKKCKPNFENRVDKNHREYNFVLLEGELHNIKLYVKIKNISENIISINIGDLIPKILINNEEITFEQEFLVMLHAGDSYCVSIPLAVDLLEYDVYATITVVIKSCELWNVNSVYLKRNRFNFL